MENNHDLPRPAADAATLNAIVDAMGAITMCLMKHMPPHVKEEFVRDMARLSANATASGHPLAGTLMNDISRAANR